jgi:predicted DsbA family dithiol-disulfide isomerase
MSSIVRRTVTIDIVSDAICPWCYVGKRRLAAALATLPNVDASIRWRPFYLDPSLPVTGVDKMTHYIKKFGRERVNDIIPKMAAVGRGLAPPVAFDYGGRIHPTSWAHVMIEAAWAAGGAALQDAVVEALFAHYFEKKGDLTKAEVARVAASAGFAGAAAVAGGQALVDEEVAHWRREFGVQGVPFFIINGGAATLSGAQESAVLADAITRVLANTSEDD